MMLIGPNGSNVKNKNIERDDQEKINEEESPNTNFDVGPLPRRTTRIRRAVDRYEAAPCV